MSEKANGDERKEIKKTNGKAEIKIPKNNEPSYRFLPCTHTPPSAVVPFVISGL
jgi:hypothetical protein